MLGYWLGAMFVSVTLGLVIVFALEGSSAVQTREFAVWGLVVICVLLAARGILEAT